MTHVDVDELVREARDLRAKLTATAVKLDAFTEALQANVDRLRVISEEITAESEPGTEVADDPT